ncbi:MAG TPA: hypothetical protein VJM34_12890 [Novosphingobium sp.]|nr:hypothetical protein [Novosphingobium sp.]
MFSRFPMIAALVLAPLLSGCLSTAASIVTAPVRVAGKAADWATTSQSEADEQRGREMRKREERLGKLERSYGRNRQKCDRGDDEACEAARADYDEMQDLMPSVPYERY